MSPAIGPRRGASPRARFGLPNRRPGRTFSVFRDAPATRYGAAVDWQTASGVIPLVTLMSDPGETTRLLAAARNGDAGALDRVVTLVYDELCAMAHRQLTYERTGHTLDTRALVHEAYLKLIGLHEIQWQDRAHFLAISARLMRRILVNHAERHSAAKRGGGKAPLNLRGRGARRGRPYPALCRTR